MLSAAGTASAADVETSNAVLEEVVVSAQHRTESAQDIPYNISVVGANQLGTVTSLTGLSQLVPGLSTVDTGPASRSGNSDYVLRGLRADAPGAFTYTKNFTLSPVAVYFGEVPVNFAMPMSDIDRVEVLRGPQGTLYGSGSLAGAVRVIPKRPEFSGFTAEMNGAGGYTEHSTSGNGSVHGVVNVPISEKLAFREVAGYERDAGFIDAVDRLKLDSKAVPVPSVPGDLTSGFVLSPVQRGVNSSSQWFSRSALRWQPDSALDLQLNYTHQDVITQDSQISSRYAGGTFDSSFGFWPNAQVQLRPGCDYCTTNWTAEPYHGKLDVGDFVATADFGFATITSASSYYSKKDLTNIDGTGIFYSIPNGSLFIPYYPYQNYPRLTQPEIVNSEEQAFTQEIRLVSNNRSMFSYVVGAYFQHQPLTANVVASTPGLVAYNQAIGLPTPSLTGDQSYFILRSTKFLDKAVFGELTSHLTSRWQLTFGLRLFKENFSTDSTVLVPVCGAVCAEDLTDPLGRSRSRASQSASRAVKKLNTSFDVTDESKVYATYSEGFRRGGATGLSLAGPYASRPEFETFQPDLAKNYEVGVKGTGLNRRVRYSADLYLIDLDNFQFNSFSGSGVPAAFNGSKARSKGAELEVQALLTDALSANAGYAYTQSVVRRTFDIIDYVPFAVVPGAGVNGQTASIFGGAIAAGTKLPGVSAHVATLSLNYALGEEPTVPQGKWVFHVDAAYRSPQSSTLNPASIYYWEIPSSVVTNARVSFASNQHISYQFTINNLFNATTFSGTANAQTFQNPFMLRNVGRPRTFELGARYQFGEP